MAADTSSMAVNGNYGAANGQSYEVTEQTYDTQTAIPVQHDYATTTISSASGGATGPDISKEEVGWYFVEQYYTTLSKSPEKLYLFYTKQSQFVSGVETEKVSVCVGQKAISDKIKDLDIQDCKVRVTNVDSQGSRSNIVIQVIGEISSKAQPRRKFTQTFVLAEQINGYYVLNDIFRYIMDDDDEYEAEGEQLQQTNRVEDAAGGYQEPATTAEDAAPAGLTASQDPVAQKHDAAIVDRSLEQAVQTKPDIVVDNAVNGDDPASTDVAVAEDTPAAATGVPAATPTTADAVDAAPAVDAAEEEAPQAPEPTPTVASPKAAPAKPSGPPVIKSWANMVSGNKAVSPAIPTAASASAPKAKSPAAPTQQAATPTGPAAYTASAQESEVATPTSSGSEWQTAGPDHRRQQSRAQGGQTPSDNSRGYIKNVTETVDPDDLKQALQSMGTVIYFDVSRPKKCAFVDFATAAEYASAVASNPLEVNGQRLFVEERRIRPPGPGNFNPRGGRGNPMRGGGGFRGGRGGFRGAPRGGPQAT